VRPYPVMMNLDGKQVVVVGGGKVASRKIFGLIESGARITVISPELEDELRHLVEIGRISWLEKEFDDTVLDLFPDAVLLFGTTDRRDVNVSIQSAAVKRKMLCNIADVPDLCTFIVPAVITQGDLMISVSTGGSSPALARRIREDLEKCFGPEYAAMTRLLGELRKQILKTGGDSGENRKLFLEIVDSEVLEALRENDREKALAILRGILPQDLDPAPAMEQPQLNHEE
jgi:precorrin-2 dehydrogenase / sirohydrochlorin ferrochelatase